MTKTPAQPARRTPTLEDVAKAAGVSRATASRVVNDVGTVDPALRLRVHDAIAATGYVPNSAARTLVNRRTGTVALVMSGSDGSAEQVFADPFFGRITGGVVTCLRDRGMRATMLLADSDKARRDALDTARRESDGALLVSTHPNDPLPQLFVEAGVPAVLFARPSSMLPISFVDVGHDVGGALAAGRLADRGCRRIATIAGPADLPAAIDRLAGFERALQRRGIPYVHVARGNFTAESGEQAMTELLAQAPDLDGVFAANDLMAVGALRVLRDAGRAVPDDVALIGFDDSQPARLTRPRLTTISQPVEAMAAHMTTILLTHLTTPETPPTSVVFDPHLVPRETA
ncbi:LacI family DNA-binding transcriptional regulator [Kribbella sandramycini]|uniref:LacI family DNA-binding transcriptional regulator n=1 Tax=Kribbella sandramycini TaxID=60450 RepID=UPI0031DBAF40